MTAAQELGAGARAEHLPLLQQVLQNAGVAAAEG
jgi:hypothetical protein